MKKNFLFILLISILLTPIAIYSISDFKDLENKSLDQIKIILKNKPKEEKRKIAKAIISRYKAQLASIKKIRKKIKELEKEIAYYNEIVNEDLKKNTIGQSTSIIPGLDFLNQFQSEAKSSLNKANNLKAQLKEMPLIKKEILQLAYNIMKITSHLKIY